MASKSENPSFLSLGHRSFNHSNSRVIIPDEVKKALPITQDTTHIIFAQDEDNGRVYIMAGTVKPE